MSLLVSVARRFKVTGTLHERRKPMETPSVPASGMLLDFGDGPPVSVSHVVLHLRPAEWTPGFYPCAATVFTTPESGDRLAATEASGWRPPASQ